MIGPEVVSNLVQHIRMKLPHHALSSEGESSFLAGSVSWHQDLGVLTEEADAATILSVWVPITDATVENGCLKVIPGSHRRDLLDHCPTGRDLGIPDKLLTLQEAVPVPMRAGSALIFGQQLIHGSLDNVTHDEVRDQHGPALSAAGTAERPARLPVVPGAQRRPARGRAARSGRVATPLARVPSAPVRQRAAGVQPLERRLSRLRVGAPRSPRAARAPG